MRSSLTVLLAFALSALLTHLFVRWSAAKDHVAHENHRSMHKGRVPVGGGLPLLASTLAAALMLWPDVSNLKLIPAVLAMLVVVSWIDDRKALNPVVRLAAHLAAASAAVMALPAGALVLQGWLPFALDRLAAILALTWFINLYNFMDGIDGIAGTETAVLAAGYAAICYVSASQTEPLYALAVALTGATLAFLLWNWSPARVFMGDVGSVPLGFLTGVMMLDIAVRHSLAAALILPLYFAADATITLIRRIIAGEKPWEAHRTHFYQRAALGLGSHAPVVVRIAVCNGVLMICAVLALTAPFLAMALAALAAGLLLLNLNRAAQL